MFLPLVLLRNEYQGVFFLLEKAGKSACMEQEKALANVKPGRGEKKRPLEAGEQNFWPSLHSQASVGCHESHKAHGCVQDRVGVMGACRYSLHCHETQIC